jgi:hypothetical protein
LAAGEILPPFCVYRACRSGCCKVRVNGKKQRKNLVKRFCEKNFTEFLARLEKTVSVFTSSLHKVLIYTGTGIDKPHRKCSALQ